MCVIVVRLMKYVVCMSVYVVSQCVLLRCVEWMLSYSIIGILSSVVSLSVVDMFVGVLLSVCMMQSGSMIIVVFVVSLISVSVMSVCSMFVCVVMMIVVCVVLGGGVMWFGVCM